MTEVSLLDKLRGWVDLSHAEALSSKEFDELTNGIEDALPAVVALVEAARVFADPFHAKTEEELRAFRAALAPFVGEVA